MATKMQRFSRFEQLNFVKNNSTVHKVRLFSLNQVSWSKEKLTVELLPEVSNSLESGEIKHRNHPGIRKINPITVPGVLSASVIKLISYESEKKLLIEANKLCKHLSWRRLPAEKEEIDKKISKMFPEFCGDYEQIPDVLNKQELKELRKRINLEMGRWKPIEYDYHTSLAYLVGRLAPNFASTNHVFDELKKSAPNFKPETYFDFGSGVGSALWAAHSHWSDSIKEYFCTDISSDMNDLCRNLITDEISEEKHIKPVFFRQFLPASDTVKYDLVVSAFSLLELHNSAERLKVIETLWRKTKEYLVIIEFGTVAGFSCVLDARDFILQVENNSSPEFAFYNSGAHVVSPCAHDFICPKFAEKSNTTCGFLVPYHPLYPRVHSQVVLKDWISYVILKKSPRTNDTEALPRVVKPVLKKPRHVICRLCCSDGKLKEVTITKSKHGRHAYRCARECNQGDILPVNIKHAEMSEVE